MKISLSCFVLTLSFAVLGSCSSGSSNNQYLKIPNAVFVSGKPVGSLTTTTPKPVVTAPSSTTYVVNTTVTWSVDFSAAITAGVEIKDVIIEVDEIDGYFVYPLTDAEIAAGAVDIDTEVVTTEPVATEVCNRDYRGNGTCYQKANEGVTGMDFTAAADDGTNLAWAPLVEQTVLIPVVEDDNNSSSGDEYCSGWTTMCSCNLRACSDGTNSWYDVGTGVYYCASPSNCTTAAQNAVAWCTRGC